VNQRIYCPLAEGRDTKAQRRRSHRAILISWLFRMTRCRARTNSTVMFFDATDKHRSASEGARVRRGSSQRGMVATNAQPGQSKPSSSRTRAPIHVHDAVGAAVHRTIVSWQTRQYEECWRRRFSGALMLDFGSNRRAEEAYSIGSGLVVAGIRRVICYDSLLLSLHQV
jgi:hypothetical protein